MPKLFLIFLFSCFLTACSPLDVVKAVVAPDHTPLLNVDTQVGDKSASVGTTQQIKSNHGVAIAHDQYSGQSLTVQQDTPSNKILLYALMGFVFGFLVGWPISGTPQKFIRHIFEKRRLSKRVQEA